MSLNQYLPIEICLKINSYLNKCCICQTNISENFNLDIIKSIYQKCDHCIFLELNNQY